jgi:hypothetical protein
MNSIRGFYCGWATLATPYDYEAIINNGYPADKVVGAMIGKGDGRLSVRPHRTWFDAGIFLSCRRDSRFCASDSGLQALDPPVYLCFGP